MSMNSNTGLLSCIFAQFDTRSGYKGQADLELNILPTACAVWWCGFLKTVRINLLRTDFLLVGVGYCCPSVHSPNTGQQRLHNGKESDKLITRRVRHLDKLTEN